MSGEKIHLTDWQRILVGEVPGSFYLELIIRAVFVYLVLMVAMRLLGQRMASRLNVTEMASLVSLAAAVGIPLLSPDRGLLIAVVIAIVIVGVGRFAAWLSLKSPRIERAIDGRVAVLIEDSVLCLGEMETARLPRERVLGQLRAKGIIHLGEVRQLLFEAGGAFTLIPETEKRAGLCILPEWDTDFIGEQQKSESVRVCQRCGNARADKAGKASATAVPATLLRLPSYDHRGGEEP